MFSICDAITVVPVTSSPQLVAEKTPPRARSEVAGGSAGNQYSGVGCAEAVVDVDHRHVWATGVQHGKQGRCACKRGTVAYRSRYGDDGYGYKTADD